MTLYYKLVFALLATEIATLTALISPLPQKARRVISDLQNNTGPVVSSIAYSVKIMLLLDMVFFVDSVNRYRTITTEAAKSKADNPAIVHDVATESSFRARTSYAQRNMYLTGFTIFFAFVIIRVFNLLASYTAAEARADALQVAQRDGAKFRAQLVDEKHSDTTTNGTSPRAAIEKLAQ